MMKMLKWLGLTLATLFTVMQFIQVEKTHPAIDETRSIQAHTQITPEVAAIFKRACQDCHSNKTQWPWYSHVAPVSWLLSQDVVEGRARLNFSDWARYDRYKVDDLLKDISLAVESGSMPFASYTLLHPEAKLSRQDVKAICDWTKAERQRLVDKPEANPSLRGDISFLRAQNFEVGRSPMSVAVGDFNGDGILDVATANIHSNNVTVLLGQGNGTFRTAQTIAVGKLPISITSGDFNGDKRLDLAVANRDSNDISILLGHGDGTFQATPNFPVERSPGSVTVGDFDGDNHLDLALSNGLILLGKGDGTFRRAPDFGVRGRFVTVGDFNGDNRLDLVVADAGISPLLLPGTVFILLGRGDGTFQSRQDFRVGRDPISVTVGDFNGDKRPDLAVVTHNSANVLVLMGNGDGTFRPAQELPVPFGANAITSGDFNGDGIEDLAVVNGHSHSILILLGNGDGTFRATRDFGVGRFPRSLAVGDFNGDTRLDLVVVNIGPDGPSSNVSILINQTSKTTP